MKEKYINEVLNHIHANNKIKKRIKEDLNSLIDEYIFDDPFANLEERFGNPEELALEFMENLDIKEQSNTVAIGISRSNIPYEFKSKKTLFGLPLIHINTGGAYKVRTAKGIIAIGDIALGLVSIGGLSLGLITLGGISLGLIAIAGISLGLVSIGGIAIGGLTIGAISIGFIKAIGAITTLFK